MITKKISVSISAFSNHLAIFLWQLLFVREFITFSCFGLLKLAFQKNTIFFKWYLAIPYEASIRSQDSGETSYILFLAIIAFTLRYILLSRILKVSKTFHISWQFAQIFVFWVLSTVIFISSMIGVSISMSFGRAKADLRIAGAKYDVVFTTDSPFFKLFYTN